MLGSGSKRRARTRPQPRYGHNSSASITLQSTTACRVSSPESRGVMPRNCPLIFNPQRPPNPENTNPPPPRSRNAVLFVDQHRVGEAKFTDRGGDLRDLLVAVRARVSGVGDQRRAPAPNNRLG